MLFRKIYFYLWVGCCVIYVGLAHLTTPTQSYYRTSTARPTHLPTQSAGEFVALSQIQDEAGTTVDWSPNGEWLAVGDDEGTLKIWDVNTQSTLGVFELLSNWVSAIAWSADSLHLTFASSDGVVIIWNVETDQRVEYLDLDSIEDDFDRHILSMDWSPDGNLLAIGGSHDMSIWQLSDMSLVLIIDAVEVGTIDAVLQIAWSEDGSLLATANGQCSVSIWDTEKGDEIVRLSESEYGRTCSTGLHWLPDSNYVVALAGDNLSIYDALTGEVVETLDDTGKFWGIDLHSDGVHLATRTYTTIEIWDISTNQKLVEWDNMTIAMDWSDTELQLVSLDADKTITIWGQEAEQ